MQQIFDTRHYDGIWRHSTVLANIVFFVLSVALFSVNLLLYLPVFILNDRMLFRLIKLAWIFIP